MSYGGPIASAVVKGGSAGIERYANGAEVKYGFRYSDTIFASVRIIKGDARYGRWNSLTSEMWEAAGTLCFGIVALEARYHVGRKQTCGLDHPGDTADRSMDVQV